MFLPLQRNASSPGTLSLSGAGAPRRDASRAKGWEASNVADAEEARQEPAPGQERALSSSEADTAFVISRASRISDAQFSPIRTKSSLAWASLIPLSSSISGRAFRFSHSVVGASSGKKLLPLRLPRTFQIEGGSTLVLTFVIV